jgi:hypothetical protein
MLKNVFCDVDDLICERQIEQYLVPLHEQVPRFRITCYSIPNKLGPVHALKERYPWVTFAQHGAEHTQFECRAWTEDEALYFMLKSRDMGYELIFKPPNWIFDGELVEACRKLGVILHHHKDSKYPFPQGVRRYPGPIPRNDHINVHSHITKNPVTDFVGDHPAFAPERLAEFEKFCTIDELVVGGL